MAILGPVLGALGCQTLLPERESPASSRPAGSDDARAPDDASEDAGADSGALGLVAHWPFDTEAGSLTREVVGAHDGVFDKPPTWSKDGKFGGCVSFDGSRTMTVTSLGGPAFPQNGTLAMWLRSSYPAGNRPIFANVAFRQHLFVRATNDAGVQVGGEWRSDSGHTGPYAWAGTADVPRDRWHHIALTWGPPPARLAILYLDGFEVLRREGIDPTWTPDDQEFVVGSYGCCGGYVGDLDELYLYSRALTPEEIRALAVP